MANLFSLRERPLKQARFYCESIETGEVELSPDEAHHLASVLRLAAGERVELFDGKGTVAQAVIKNISHKTVMLQVDTIHREPARTTGRIIIAASLPKAQRFDRLVTKCTELGVDHIAAVIFERTVKLAKGPSVLARYNKLALAAAKQCGRLFLPEITGPADLQQTLALLKNDYPNAQLIFGSFSEEARPVFEFSTSDNDIVAFVGPEGGFTEEEARRPADAGFRRAALGPAILRVETAAIALQSFFLHVSEGLR